MTFLFLFSLKLRRYLHIWYMLFSASSCRTTFLSSQVSSLSVRRSSSIHYPIRRLILRNSSVLFSLILTKFSCFLILCLGFRRHLSHVRVFNRVNKNPIILVKFKGFTTIFKNTIQLCLVIDALCSRSNDDFPQGESRFKSYWRF